MKLLENILNYYSDLYLQKEKQKVKDFFKDEKLKNEFDLLQPRIIEEYDKVAFWHGTGRYHYKLNGNSKYEGVSNEIDDILNSILVDGLRPFHDPFIKISSDYTDSVSTAYSRFYACCYAKFHQEEGHEFIYEYGSSKFWFWYVFFLTSLQDGTPLKTISYFNKSRKKSIYIEKGRLWISTLRKDFKDNKWSIFKILQNLRSDIQGNYGIIIGIKDKGFKTLDMSSRRWGRLEVRITEVIKMENYTHIEVPLENYYEVKALFKELNINLPLFPIEFGEIISSKKRIYDIVNNK